MTQEQLDKLIEWARLAKSALIDCQEYIIDVDFESGDTDDLYESIDHLLQKFPIEDREVN